MEPVLSFNTSRICKEVLPNETAIGSATSSSRSNVFETALSLPLGHAVLRFRVTEIGQFLGPARLERPVSCRRRRRLKNTSQATTGRLRFDLRTL